MHHNNITAILGLTEFDATFMMENSAEIFIRIEKKTTVELCPCCQEPSQKVHQRRKQLVKDLPIRGKLVKLVLIKRRFRCLSCGKVFTETYQTISRYQRMTNRLIEFLKSQTIKAPFTHAAKSCDVSPTTAKRYFDKVAAELAHKGIKTPEWLALDEFAGTTASGKYHLAVADPHTKKLLDILPNRKRKTVEHYLRTLDGASDVRVVCIDMWRHFKAAIHKAMPDAAIVIDKFHVVRNVLWALDKVRKRVARALAKEQKQLLKKRRLLLLANYENLDRNGQKKLAELCSGLDELRIAYELKETFRAFYTSPDRQTAHERLCQWYQAVANSGIREFAYLVRTIKNWENEILNYFDYRVTNGFIEGMNNKIKTIKRTAYGFRSFTTYKAKILLNQ